MSRKLWFAIGVLVVVIIGAGAWALRGEYAAAQAVAAQAAKETCSCVHVSRRALDACIADLPADIGRQTDVQLENDHVRASVLLGAVSANAAYDEAYGCRLLD